MLLTLHRFAVRIKWARPVAIVLGLAGLAGLIASLFASGGNLGHLLEPSLVLMLWGMMLFSFIQLFQRIPPPVLPHDDFMTRLGGKIILACYSSLAFLVVVVSCALAWMSLRLIYLD
jgi:hypothetical protein